MQLAPSAHLSSHLFPLYLQSRLSVDLELLLVRGLEFKVMGQAYAVGPTSIDGSFSSLWIFVFLIYSDDCDAM